MRLPIQPEKSRITMVPLWISEVALAFLAGVMCGLIEIPSRFVVFFACIAFALATMVDPLLFHSFHFRMDFLIVGNALACLYLVLGRAIYDAR